MMDKVVGESQHPFMEGRQILDAALVANDVVNGVLLKNREGVLCKLDMKKPMIV